MSPSASLRFESFSVFNNIITPSASSGKNSSSICVIMLLNTEKLSKRSDALGDIFSDLLVSGNVELKNKDMEKRRKEVFTKEEVRKMCIEEQKLVDKFTEENRISDIKFMYTEGISPEKIAKGTKLTLEKVKKILEIE